MQVIKNLKRDFPSGLAVFLVALPLCLGIALASGAPLLSGLVSGVIGGIVVGLISSSHTSVSGPAAGLAAIVLASITKLGGFEVFSAALLLAGVIQAIAGFLKTGIIANYIPSNVIKGLLAAIGILLILKQIPHALGYDTNHEDIFAFTQPNGENTFSHLFLSYQHLTPGAIIISITSIVIIVLWEKTSLKKLKYLPSSLFVVVIGILINELFRILFPAFYVSDHHLVSIPPVTIQELFNFKLPTWAAFSDYNVWMVALTLAIVASLETLLNLEAVDSIDPHKRESPPNKELVAQGIGNILAGIFGGLPVTSVIVRGSVNITSGAQSKLSSILHGVFLFVSILALSSFLNLIPLASLAAILIMIGYKLANAKLFKEMYYKGWKQLIPFAATIISIVLTDLLIGILIGLTVSIFYLLKSNYKNPFVLEKVASYNDETVRIELPNQVSFLNKAVIKKTLLDIPMNTKVIIDARYANFIDNDVLEILKDFKEVIAPERSIKLNMICLRNEYRLSDHIQFTAVMDKQMQEQLTPAEILEFLKRGNERFVNGKESEKFLKHQVSATSTGQYPMAVVLGCIDSMASPELIFDSNIGDLISIRIAGNIVNDDIIGSLELSYKEIGTKLIVVMGHSNCGAVNAAMESLSFGNIGSITSKITAAIRKENLHLKDLDKHDKILKEKITLINTEHSVMEIYTRSPFLRAQIIDGKLGIVSAYYDTASGRVDFNELEKIMV